MKPCPSIFELTSAQVLPPQLAAHVADCARCRAIRAAWEADATQDEGVAPEDMPDVQWPHEVYGASDAEPVPGALHCIWGGEDGRLLVGAVLELDDREALVVPVSDQPQLAGDWDILLDDDVLPYPAMLEVWNHLRVLREQVMEQVARLDDGWLAGLGRAYADFMTGAALQGSLRQGPPLVGEKDPRFRFRDAESERMRDFTEAWRILFAADSLGGVVRGRREACELELAQLGDDVDIPPASLERLEADQEDLDSQVPKVKLIRLIRRLQLPASGRLIDLVEQAVTVNASQAPPELGMAQARRRRGARSARPDLPEEVRRQIAARYISGLLDSLRDDS